jgi:ketosteroid isomerase-like protein
MSKPVAPKGDDPILELRQKYLEAWRSGDIDGVISFVADDVVVMSPNDSTLYGAAEYREWLEEYFQNFRITALSEPDRTIVVDGDYATEYATYMLAVTPVGATSRIRDDGRFLTIWKRQPGGAWKIWQTLWNSERPIGIGTNRHMWRSMHNKNRANR